MQYRPFGKTGKMLSALGIGTTRFPAKTEADIENAVRLILEAVKGGVNYIDTSHNYLGGKAEEIVGAALKRTNKEVYVTVKSNYVNDRTADECYDRIRASLKHIGIKKAHFFIMWSVFSHADFIKMTQTGSLYDGALRAKKEGLIDHICASLHCPATDMIKIIESGLIEGITVTYSALNQRMMRDVLRRAAELNIGIVTMNTLGGGLIPQNGEYFSFLKLESDETVSRAALSFVYSNKEITTMLSGMTNMDELNDNLGAVSRLIDDNEAEKRISLAERGFSGIKGYCTGCGYCTVGGDCPAAINTAAFMYSYNSLFLPGGVPDFRRSEKRLLENIRICYRLKMSFNIMPESAENPCLKCGNCEEKCTQKIPIIERLDEMYRRFGESGYNKKHIIDKITEVFGNNYTKIGLWPASIYTSFIIEYVREILPGLNAQLFIFDKNEKLWGTLNSGIEVRNPALIPQIKPDAIVITNYNYEADIYESIKHYETDGVTPGGGGGIDDIETARQKRPPLGGVLNNDNRADSRKDGKIRVLKLHDKNDIPWGGFN